MARIATGMPTWVKIFIGIGIAAVLVVGVMMGLGHCPWQHGGMAGMHG
ncbi:MAG: hypothetical protein ABIQ30_04680 [Devosia sp.]